MDKYIKSICDLANSLSRTFYVAMTNTDYETESTSQTSLSNTRETDKVIFNKIDGTRIISESVQVITEEMIDPYCEVVTEVIIPQGVTEIARGAFVGCSGLTSINIPNSVTSIGKWAFGDCSGLTEIKVPDGVTSIGDGAFGGCTSLTSITIPDGVTSIGFCAFEGCSSLTSITIPKSVTSIGERAFFDCSGLTEIKIPDGVTSIGECAFYGCRGLTSITIPKSVTKIGNWALKGCTSLTSINIPDSVTEIGERAFSDCTGLTSIEIPNSVTEIGERAFSDCTGLTSITIPDGVTGIGNEAFSDCTSLTSITIPKSVTSIGDGAFQGCTSLTSITISEGVTSIGEWAFKGCTSLTSITIPNSVTEIGDSAFRDCTELKYIIVPERFKNQTAAFWQDRGVDINHTAIYGLQDIRYNTTLHLTVLDHLQNGVHSSVYKSLTPLNPLAHVSVSALFIASSKLANLTSEPANLCLPSIVLSKGTGLVNATMDNWRRLFSPLGSNAYACADVLAEWLSIYDIARIQMAKATGPRSEDMQVVLYDRLRALQSEEFEKSSHLFTLRNPHRTLPQSNLNEFSLEASARPAA